MARRLPRLDLTVGLEAFEQYPPLGLHLPEVPEESLLLGIVLPDPLQASLHEALYVPLVESKNEMELIRLTYAE